METHFELHEGVACNGGTVWLVVTVRNIGSSWRWIERFHDKVEAVNWMKWA